MLRDPEKTKNEVVEWIRDYFEENGKGCKAVIGISGGKDSSIAAALCAEALGRTGYRAIYRIPGSWLSSCRFRMWSSISAVRFMR